MTNKTSLLSSLRDDMKTAWKAGDNGKRDTLRLVIASVENARIASKTDELDDQEVLRVIQKEAKQRKESISEFTKGNRQDLVEKEQAELDVISLYLPEEMSDETLEAIIKNVIDETKVTSINDIGVVMKTLMPRLEGMADGKKANAIVRNILS
tara:strand:+ start:34 stop:492 length:459 start_codon:yes stop_codon:yes gene_type:complete